MSMYNHPSLKNESNSGDTPKGGVFVPTDDQSDCVNMEEGEPLSSKLSKCIEAFHQRFGEPFVYEFDKQATIDSVFSDSIHIEIKDREAGLLSINLPIFIRYEEAELENVVGVFYD